MAIIHIDYTNGDDTTGDGSSGTPYKTLTKAFAVLTNVDSIKIANTSAQQESNLAFPAVTFTLDRPLIIEAWDNGGSLEITTPGANISPAAVIDNSGTTNPLFSNNINNVKFIGIEFTDFTTDFWTGTKTNVSFYQCYFNDCASYGSWSGCGLINCSFRKSSGNAGSFSFGTSSLVYGCYFDNVGVTLSTGVAVLNSIFYKCVTNPALTLGSADFTRVIGNTFIGRDLNSASTDVGIRYGTASSEDNIVMGNHFQDYTGAGSLAIETTAVLPTTRGTFFILGANSFYNVDTEYESGFSDATVVDLMSKDIVEGADPLTDVSTLDFTKKSTATSFLENPAFTGYLATATPSNLTTGGPQNEGGTGGGGGDTESSYAGI